VFPFIGSFSIKNHVPSFNLPQGHTFKGRSFRKWGNNGIVEVDLIVEAKYVREEGEFPSGGQALNKGVDLQKVEEDFLEDVGAGHLVAPLRTPLGTHGTHHGIWPPYPLFLKLLKQINHYLTQFIPLESIWMHTFKFYFVKPFRLMVEFFFLI
jgi:hypothetical protein